jgi:thiaminase
MAYDNPLEKELTAAEEALVKTEQSVSEAARFKAKVADLKKIIPEIEAKKKEYKKAAPGIAKRRTDHRDYVDRQMAMVENVVDAETLEKVRKVYHGAVEKLAKLEKEADANAVDKLKFATTKTQAAYTRLLTIHTSILKDLDGLKTAADKEFFETDNLGRLYLLLLFMDGALAELDAYLDADTYVEALQNAARAYLTAADKEREAKAKADAAAAQEKVTNKELQDQRAKGRELALQQVEEGPGKASGTASTAEESGGTSQPTPS